MPRRVLITVLLLAGLYSAAPSGAVVDLPDMGESSATALSAAEERRIGRSMLGDLRSRGMLLGDIEVNRYIQSLGLQLASSGEPTRYRPEFFVVDAPQINAFAMPGGYIGVNAGLILAARSENELAAVLAHELAHVSQRHIARTVERAQELSIPLTAALIAAIILGSQDADAAQAAMATTLASQAQMQLDFSRANEREADRVGMDLLVGAGFEPDAMAGFFERLGRESRFSADIAPEFLRTHPVTDSRIADARNRSTQLPTVTRGDSTDFRLIQARIEVLSAKQPAALLETFRLRDGATASAAERYGHALLAATLGYLDDAAERIADLRKEDPERIAYRTAAARIDVRRGDTAVALAQLREGLELYPYNPLLTVAFAEAALAAGQPQAAARRLRDLLERPAAAPPGEAYRLLARAEAELEHPGASHLAQAEYYYAGGDLFGAIEQLQTALKDSSLDYYTASRAQARLDELKSEADATEKR